MKRIPRALPSVMFQRLLQPSVGLRRLCWPITLSAACAGLACESGPVTPGPAREPATAAAGAAPQSASPAAPVAAGAPSAGSADRFGAAIEPGPTVALATLLSDPKSYASQTVTTEGRVQRACSRKGCWMEIGEGEDACRVTFKDYGFFVPTDSAGAYAKIQGRLDTREVERAAVEHLESEGARFRNKKSDGSATEVRLIASAVELRR
jgi:Domain of unknown function (DUF4920)